MGQRYRLSDIERRLIVSWNLCADLSVREIAQRADTREHRIRHALGSLIENGILTPTFLIDNYRLGYSDCALFFAPSAESSDLRRRFEESLLDCPRIIWLARMSGSFQYGATFMARKPLEIVDFFASIQSQSRGAYAQKTLRIGIDCSWFSPNYLIPGTSARETVSITARESAPEPDSIDISILLAMNRFPAASVAELARAVGMSVSSMAYRIDRLRAQKIVRGRMFSLNTTLLGILMYRVMIVDCGLTQTQRQELFTFCSQCPNVVAFVVCTGSWDYELRFESEYPEALDEFCQSLIDKFGRSIGSVLVSQQLLTLKRCPYPGEIAA